MNLAIFNHVKIEHKTHLFFLCIQVVVLLHKGAFHASTTLWCLKVSCSRISIKHKKKKLLFCVKKWVREDYRCTKSTCSGTEKMSVEKWVFPKGCQKSMKVLVVNIWCMFVWFWLVFAKNKIKRTTLARWDHYFLILRNLLDLITFWKSLKRKKSVKNISKLIVLIAYCNEK